MKIGLLLMGLQFNHDINYFLGNSSRLFGKIDGTFFENEC